METLRDYVIIARYLVRDVGWKCDTVTLTQTTLQAAWKRASETAKSLDVAYQDDHFWTVDVKDPEGSSYVQLFHGRLE